LYHVSGYAFVSCMRLSPVSEALSSSTGDWVLPEILWNFSHFNDKRRLRLAQNPHFYEALPASSGAYGGGFRSQPTELYKGTIYVITNTSRRVFLEFDGKLRVFDHVSVVNNTLIFRGWCFVHRLFP
jgi:hypothetical protein